LAIAYGVTSLVELTKRPGRREKVRPALYRAGR